MSHVTTHKQTERQSRIQSRWETNKRGIHYYYNILFTPRIHIHSRFKISSRTILLRARLRSVWADLVRASERASFNPHQSSSMRIFYDDAIASSLQMCTVFWSNSIPWCCCLYSVERRWLKCELLAKTNQFPKCTLLKARNRQFNGSLAPQSNSKRKKLANLELRFNHYNVG